MNNLISKQLEEFDKQFTDKEGCQAGNPECGKKMEINGSFYCSSCEKRGGMEGEPKDWKRPVATSKQIKLFIKSSQTQLIDKIREEIENFKRQDFKEDGFCNFCNGHKDNIFHKEYCGIYNQALQDILNILNELKN